MALLKNMLKTNRPKPFNRYLAQTYGGKWTYDGMCSWNCDDGKRRVIRTANCSCDDYCNHPPAYWLYEDNKIPIRVY